MMPSPYDLKHLDEILKGSGDWFDADLFRFLDAVLFKADREHFQLLYGAFPVHCRAILHHYGWEEGAIETKLYQMGVYAVGS